MPKLLPLLLALLLAGTARADDASTWMQRYRAALQQEDVSALGHLIAADAHIRLTMEMPQQPSMTFTLTRAEFLQQQGALWRFSHQSSFTIDQVQTQGQTLSFQQQSSYDLFHQDYRLHSDINATLAQHDGQVQLTSLTLLTRER